MTIPLLPSAVARAGAAGVATGDAAGGTLPADAAAAAGFAALVAQLLGQPIPPKADGGDTPASTPSADAPSAGPLSAGAASGLVEGHRLAGVAAAGVGAPVTAVPERGLGPATSLAGATLPAARHAAVPAGVAEDATPDTVGAGLEVAAELPAGGSAGVSADSRDASDQAPAEEAATPELPGSLELTDTDLVELMPSAVEGAAGTRAAPPLPSSAARATAPEVGPIAVAAPALAGAEPTAPAAAPPGAPPQAAPQLLPPLLAVHRGGADGAQGFTVTLTPEELGTVRVSVELRDGELHLALAGSGEASREALRSALPELRRMLEDAGVRTGTFGVAPEDPSGSGGVPGGTGSRAGDQPGAGSGRASEQDRPGRPGAGSAAGTDEHRTAVPTTTQSRDRGLAIRV